MQLRERIEQAFENRATLAPGNAPAGLPEAIDECLALLGSGRARVAEPDGHGRLARERMAQEGGAAAFPHP